jgi:hypothetical protein
MTAGKNAQLAIIEILLVVDNSASLKWVILTSAA